MIQYQGIHCYFPEQDRIGFFEIFWGVEPEKLKKLYWRFEEYLPKQYNWETAYFDIGPKYLKAGGQPCVVIQCEYDCFSTKEHRREEVLRLFRMFNSEWLIILQGEGYI